MYRNNNWFYKKGFCKNCILKRIKSESFKRVHNEIVLMYKFVKWYKLKKWMVKKILIQQKIC